MKPAVYLHGFASSPQSSKAQYFRQRFADRGVDLQIPQLDEGNFEALTVTSQLRVIDRTVKGEPAILIGSSLGGYLAALYAEHHLNIERLVLLAPAFEFPRRWWNQFSLDDLARWKRDGTRNFYHYAYREDRPLGYQFVEDAARYEQDQQDFWQPALILHGIGDPVVPAEVSRRFAQRHANVKLCLIDAGHELTDVLDRLWVETAMFLGFQNP